MELVIITAVAKNGVIGNDGSLPWHYPEEMRHFVETTTGHPVIMGRVNYEDIEAGLDGPLPFRTNIVLSRGDPDVSSEVVVVADVESAIDAARETGTDRAFVAGGATVYEQFLPLADRMILTEIHAEYEGDTYFPKWDRNEWREVRRDDRGEFSIVEYERTDRA